MTPDYFTPDRDTLDAVPPLRIEPLPGYAPTIGRLVGMLEYVRHTLVRVVEDMTVADLDHLHDPTSNSIGGLLAHGIAVERWYQIVSFEDRVPTDADETPIRAALELGDLGRATLRDRDVTSYLDELADVRRRTLDAFAARDDHWLEAPLAALPEANPHWAWFHVAEDAISHRGQIVWLRNRLPKNGSGPSR